MISFRVAQLMAETHQEVLKGTYDEVGAVRRAVADPDSYYWGDTEEATSLVRRINHIEPATLWVVSSGAPNREILNWIVEYDSNGTGNAIQRAEVQQQGSAVGFAGGRPAKESEHRGVLSQREPRIRALLRE